jgi:hypothetical protein
VPHPKGSFSWHHLWFVVYILVYSLIGIPIFAYVRSDSGQRLSPHFRALLLFVPGSDSSGEPPSIAVALTLAPVADDAQLIAD